MSSSPFPRMKMPDVDLDEDIGDFIGYTTLAVFALLIVLRLPSFIKYRIKTPSRSSSFKSKGYFFSRSPGLDESSNKSKLAENSKDEPISHALQNNKPTSNPLLRARLTLSKLYNTNVPYVTASSGLNLGKLSLMAAYMGLLIILALYKNTDDDASLNNFKRMGFIAVSQFPLLFSLAIKNSPLTYFVGIGYEKINFFHRFIGRMIFVFAVVHGALQIRLHHEITGSIEFSGASTYGLIALCTLALINLTSNKFFRNAFYQAFLMIHILGYLMLIVVLWKHADCTRPFMQACLGILLFDVLMKTLKSRVKSATFTAMPAGLTRIEVQGVSGGWRAGQHVFLRVLKGRNIFEKHPFTIANAPNSSTPFKSNNNLVIVAKAAGDFTKRLHKLAGKPQQLKPIDKGSPVNSQNESLASPTKVEHIPTAASEVAEPFFSSDVSYYVLVDGPYGTFFTDMTRYPTVLLFAGGSGFTYCMATLEDIVGEKVKSGKCLTKHISVVWSLREPEMIDSFGHEIEETLKVAQTKRIEVQIKLFLTKGGGGGDRGIIESSFPSANFQIFYTRPDPTELLSETINNRALLNLGGLAVGVCGPIGLVDGVKQAVNNLASERVEQIGGIKLHTEKFGW